MNNPSTDVQLGINTTKPITTDTIQQQLQNMTNLLNHFIQSNININQQQYQRVMYNPLPFYNSRLVYNQA